MLVHFTVNGTDHNLDVHAGELLRTALRRLRYYSVKFGYEHALTGADAVLLTMTPDQPRSYRLVNSGGMLAVQADGAAIITVEGLSVHGPRPPSLAGAVRHLRRYPVRLLHPCPGCWPPSSCSTRIRRPAKPKSVRRWPVCFAAAPDMSSRWRPCCRSRSAARRRVGRLPSAHYRCAGIGEWPTGGDAHERGDGSDDGAGGTDTQTCTKTVPVKMAPPETVVVNKPEPKVDAIKLVKGRAVFADDMELPGMLYGGLLTSPHAHARIKHIDATKARGLPGVHAVLTHMEVPRVAMPRAGRAIPIRRPTTRSAWTTRCAMWAIVWPSSPPRRARSCSRHWS